METGWGHGFTQTEKSVTQKFKEPTRQLVIFVVVIVDF